MRTLADFRPYQHAALAFCHATPRGYLAARAGSGKTAIGLAYLSDLMFDSFEIEAALIVCPKRVVRQWAKEARGWSFSAHLRFADYLGPSKEREEALKALQTRRANVLVCSFEHFPELIKTVKAADWPFGVMIYDEASRLRNGGRQGSVSWKAANAVSRKTDSRILLMSGSPRPGTAHELFGPVMLLDHGQRLGDTLGAFRAEYLEPDKFDRRSGQVFSWRLRDGAEPQLYGAIRDLFFAVAPDLGLASVTIDREVELPQGVADACRELMREQVVDFDDVEIMAGSAGVVAGKIHQMCQGSVFDTGGQVQHLHDEKLDELAQILEEVDGNVLVAYHYTHDRDRLLARFPQATDLMGDDEMEAAKAGRVSLGLLHPMSAAHGVDGLQDHFSAIVWFTVTGTWELYDQANKRIVRSGQRETVRIYRIIAANGIADRRLLERLAQREAEEKEFFQYLEQAA